jgi:hypothetical protein
MGCVSRTIVALPVNREGRRTVDGLEAGRPAPGRFIYWLMEIAMLVFLFVLMFPIALGGTTLVALLISAALDVASERLASAKGTQQVVPTVTG